MRSVLCQADWYHITPHWLAVLTLMLLKTECQVLFTFIPPAIHYIYNSFWIKKQESEQVQLTFILPSILSEIKHVNEIEQWTFNITRENPVSDLLYYRNLQGDLEETISGNVIIDFLPLGGGNIRSSSNTIRYFVLSALRSGDWKVMIVLYYCSGTSSVCVEARGCQSTPSWQSAVVYPGRHSLDSLHSLFSLSWTPSPTSSHLPQCYGKFTFWETDESWTTDWLNGRCKQKWWILRKQIIRIIEKRCNSL